MIRLLYIDDEEILLEVGREFLEESGDMLVDTADSASVAENMLSMSSYDAVVSDYQMPLMSGIDLLVRLRSQGNQIPFILFTGRGREEIVIQALNSGADAYIQKGGDPNAQFAELRHRVAEIVRRRKSEERERASKAKLNAALRSMTDAVWILDVDGSIIDSNEAFLRFFRFSANEPPPKNFLDLALSVELFHENGTPVPIELWTTPKAFQGNISQDAEFRVRRKDTGAAWWGSFSSAPIHGKTDDHEGVVLVARDITQRRMSEQRYRLLHDTMLQGVVFQDAEGKIISMNPLAEKILGKRPSEFIGSSSVGQEHLTIHEDGTPFLGKDHPAMIALRNGVEVKDVVMGYYRQDEGAYRWISITAVPLPLDGRDGSVRVYTVFKDITNEIIGKKAYARVQRSLEDAQRIGHVGSWNWNIKTGELTWSKELYRIYGMNKDEFVPTMGEFATFIHPDDREKVETTVQSILAGITPVTFEFRILRRDGHTRWLSVAGEIAEYDAEGRPLVMIGVNRDVTEERETANDLAGSRNLMSYVLEHSLAGIAVFDTDLRYLFVSRSFFKVHGIEMQNVIGMRHYDVFPRVPQKWKEIHRRALSGEVIRSDRDLFLRPDGTKDWMRWECRPWYTENGEVGGMILYTDLLKSEEV